MEGVSAIIREANARFEYSTVEAIDRYFGFPSTINESNHKTFKLLYTKQLSFQNVKVQREQLSAFDILNCTVHELTFRTVRLPTIELIQRVHRQ